MNKAYNQVREFHKACSIEMPEKPTLLSGAGHSWLNDYAESLEDICNNMKVDSKNNQVMARASYILEELIEFMRAETIEDQADALGDATYFVTGTHTLMGVKPETIFDIIHAANMGKVGPDGKVIRNEQGKIMKPEGWKENFAPESKIKAEIERQTKKFGREWNTCGTCGVKTDGYYDDCTSCIAESAFK